jgi:hypothetical protein
VHDVNQPPEEEEGGKAPQAGADFEIDWGALAKS